MGPPGWPTCLAGGCFVDIAPVAWHWLASRCVSLGEGLQAMPSCWQRGLGWWHGAATRRLLSDEATPGLAGPGQQAGRGAGLPAVLSPSPWARQRQAESGTLDARRGDQEPEAQICQSKC